MGIVIAENIFFLLLESWLIMDTTFNIVFITRSMTTILSGWTLTRLVVRFLDVIDLALVVLFNIFIAITNPSSSE